MHILYNNHSKVNETEIKKNDPDKNIFFYLTVSMRVLKAHVNHTETDKPDMIPYSCGK